MLIACSELLDTFKRRPGERDRIDIQKQFFVSLAIDAWVLVFEKRPSPKVNGLFSKALDAAFDAVGESRLGSDALKSLIYR